MRDWLIALGILVIVAVLLDVVRRMRNARRDSMQLTNIMYSGIDRDDLDMFDNEQGTSTVRIIPKPQESDDGQPPALLTESGKRRSIDLAQSVPLLMDVNDPQPRIEPSFGDDDETEDEVLNGTVHSESHVHTFDTAGDDLQDRETAGDTNSLDDAESLDEDLAATLKPDVKGRAVPVGAVRPVLDSATVPLFAGESDILSPPRVYERPADRPPPRREPPVIKESKPVVKAKLERELKMQQQDGHKGVQQLPLEDMIIISVMARDRSRFSGAALLEVLLSSGLRYGHHNIFHFYTGEDREDDSLYSVVNAVKPGTFDLNQMDTFNTPGVSLFLRLPTPGRPMDAFESMLGTARNIAESLNGELRDENRSVMTAQTIEHCRQRVRDFEMQSRLRAPR